LIICRLADFASESRTAQGRNKSADEVGKYEEVCSLKARFHKSGPPWIYGSAATGLISVKNGSNTQTKIAGFKKMFPRPYRPTLQDCASAAREQNLNRLAILFTII
jgi:hypothetical protein